MEWESRIAVAYNRYSVLNSHMKLITYTDGGARGNPGPAAFGVVIKDEAGHVVKQHGQYIGRTTNNQAEYRGLVDALDHARNLGATEVDCFLDSELLVKQMKGEYKIRDAGLAELADQARVLCAAIGKVRFTHIRRAFNTAADALVNTALDQQQEK